MSTFEDLSYSFDNFSGTVRLFPLPNLVLFPHVMQPLHIFEPRYRDMLEEALETDQMVAMAVLAPGWQEQYDARPPLYSTVCIGRIATHCKLEDGTYNVLLLGLRRAKLLRELDSKRRFRQARVELCEDYYPPDQAAAHGKLQRELRDAFLKVLPMLPEAQEQIDQLLGAEASLGLLTDEVSYMLDIEIGDKVALLAELDVHRRAEMLLEHLASAAADRAPGRSGVTPFPPDFSAN